MHFVDNIVISKYSTWFSVVRKNPNVKLKYDYIKLLLMGLNHPVSVCPFNYYPPPVIAPIDGDWIQRAREIFFLDDDLSCQPIVMNPPVFSSVSDDTRQIAAYQTLSNVGIQCYYARSDEPLYEWYFNPDFSSKMPIDPVHTKPLDWERYLSGIQKLPK